MARKPQTKKPNTHKGSKNTKSVGNSRTGNPNASKYEVKKADAKEEHLEDRSNNPAWYYFDEKLAEQVSQMSFQELAGTPLKYDNYLFDVPNIIRVHLNPAPGVQLSHYYNTSLMQTSGINMAGFRIFSKLSAYTGRIANYSPSDISIMILAMGEIISTSEVIRRAFGVSYTMNMRNRSYPREILNYGMLIDADDLFTNLSDYRTKFNALITLVNQLPIPKGIAYFDKCASLYEKLYLDAPSSMAQTLVPMPWSTWLLDETSYQGGSILVTKEWSTPAPNNYYPMTTPRPMSWYLNVFQDMINRLLNSSTLQVVYTDLLNLASKTGQEFWKLDFLYEEYQVIPEYDPNFMLQMHNATFTSAPILESALVLGTDNVTPFNDVYPDPNTNTLFYNPAFNKLGQVATGAPNTGLDALIDMMTDAPTLTDRIEVTRFVSISSGKDYKPTGQPTQNTIIDATVPDHYIVGLDFYTHSAVTINNKFCSGTLVNDTVFRNIATYCANIAWAPRVFEVDSTTGAFTGHYTSDLNFYTVVNADYIRKLHDFVGLALYDLR